ncbi:hypothetical protein [Paractinoplanes brasiliensis]|uniref:hypothetical protein n=1 Tax=Paractinoplanes brasiliensis TaxID=52695 RepID=UPI00105D2ABD|nr:hypothetical protein [Actinoplanes brasiliensis]GID29139.1 hypothetical protein Abr02nite_41220 [Actinoplanes brasiliensis]
MTHNPDGDPAAFDSTDLDAVDAWLDDPVVNALHEDLGRQFRALPPEQQLAGLIPELEKAQARYDELADVVADAPVDDPRRFLLVAMGEQLEKFRARINELGGNA